MKLTGIRLHRTGREPHTLAGAYAMDALAEADRARFERHLAGCEACAQETAGLREAAAALGAAAAASPPPGLRQRVMAAAATTRQSGPASVRVRPRLRAVLAVGAAAAAGLVALAVVFGVANGSMRQQLNQAQASSQQIAAVLTARDATMMTRPVTGGGTATIVMSPSRHALVFTAAGLPALPPSRGYELWLIGPRGDRPAGTLPMHSGMTGPVIAAGLHHGDRLGLSAEPAVGAPRPTGPMILDLPL
ncbi:MAG: anti-sigma factor [Streptosporangiaceae bacterium]|nr:anti-sigma factor [Streptosporangiaceae bacterium]